MSGPSISAWFTGDDGPESHRPRSDGVDLTIAERFGGSETPPAESCECGQTHTAAPLPRTLPVTSAERAAASMLRAWQAWKPDMTDTSAMRFLMVAFGDAAMVAGLADALDLTPAGRDLLARVEAGERTAGTDPPLPVAVLRAMADSYAKAWIDESDDEDWEGYLYAVREALRECISSGSPGYMPQRIADDYEARRIGARGMNDPPLGAS